MLDKGYYEELLKASAGKEKAWQATVVGVSGSTPAKPGMKMVVPLRSREFGNLGGGEAEHLVISKIRSEQPDQPYLQSFLLSESGSEAGEENALSTSMICGGKVTLFIEPLAAGKPLHIIGAGHCGRALAHLAGYCGFRPILLDNREEALSAVPTDFCADLLLTHYGDLEDLIEFGPDARIVIMTHGHAHDQEVLEQCLRKQFRYLGMIGSASKVAATKRRLGDKGFTPPELARVHAPVGLPIGSQTPYEIAVSILAQLIQLESLKSNS